MSEKFKAADLFGIDPGFVAPSSDDGHDPLCHIMLPIRGGCRFCAFIATVRADERQAAVQRVEALGFPDAPNEELGLAALVARVAREADIAAIKGSGNPDTPPPAEYPAKGGSHD